jgi:hypothetical protein
MLSLQKFNIMAIYQIQINERTSLGKSIIAFLQSIPQAVTFQKRDKKAAPQSELYKSLNSAFCDVRLMLDGKKRKKTLDELINELRNSND